MLYFYFWRFKIFFDVFVVEFFVEVMFCFDVDFCVDECVCWCFIDVFLFCCGRFIGLDFELGEDVVCVFCEYVCVFVVGVGGFGCELLKGFGVWWWCERCVDVGGDEGRVIDETNATTSRSVERIYDFGCDWYGYDWCDEFK